MAENLYASLLDLILLLDKLKITWAYSTWVDNDISSYIKRYRVKGKNE